jgi:hypothetical protein
LGWRPIDIGSYYFIIKPDEETFIDATDLGAGFDDFVGSE